MIRNQTPLTPVRTTPDIETDTERRLAPDKLCPNQQDRVTRRVIRELP